jgi:hypothetical protein
MPKAMKRKTVFKKSPKPLTKAQKAAKRRAKMRTTAAAVRG